MIWLYITISAYLLFALANIGDKLLVSKFKTEPLAYAFYVGFLGITSLVLIPFGVNFLAAYPLLLSIVAGFSFVIAAFFMYRAFNQGEASRAITLLGGSSPIFTFILSYIILQERLVANQLWSFIILVLAILIISWPEAGWKKINHGLLVNALLAGLFFSFNYVLTKYLYDFGNYFTVFFWTRIGGVVLALIVLAWPKFRKIIIIDYKKPKKQKGLLLLAIQIAGGAGVMAQSYALKLASATLINALQAIQYALVFVLASILGRRIPSLREGLSIKQISQKIAAIILIALGLSLLILK